MKSYLLRKCVKNWEDRENPAVRSAVGKLSGTVSLAANGILCLCKLLAGILSGSVSITADAVNNLSDAASGIVTLVGFRLAEIPPDERHPYGHARFEYLSGLGVAAMILVIGVGLMQSAVRKIASPQQVVLGIPVVAVLVGSVLVKIWLSAFQKKLGKHIDSAALLAAAADSRNDVISTAAVLVAALVEHFTSMKIDGFMGFVVASFIIYTGITLGKETISPLLGESASPELQHKIISLVEGDPLILGYHDLMVHDYGPGQRFGSVHVEMDSREDPLICHEHIDRIERRCLQEHNVHLVIHYDPVVTGNRQQDALRQMMENTLKDMDPRLRLHDFRVEREEDVPVLQFDVVLPHALHSRQQEILETLENQVREQCREDYELRVEFDPEAFNRP